jgi:hypothetical protein
VNWILLWTGPNGNGPLGSIRSRGISWPAELIQAISNTGAKENKTKNFSHRHWIIYISHFPDEFQWRRSSALHSTDFLEWRTCLKTEHWKKRVLLFFSAPGGNGSILRSMAKNTPLGALQSPGSRRHFAPVSWLAEGRTSIYGNDGNCEEARMASLLLSQAGWWKVYWGFDDVVTHRVISITQQDNGWTQFELLHTNLTFVCSVFDIIMR